MNRPRLITQLDELRRAVGELHGQGKRVGLVPTMGALHEGHLSLVRASDAACDQTVVTVYVNPSQFGVGEDFQKYPRTLESDLDALAECGAPLVFAPSDDAVYPGGYTGWETWVEMGSVAEPLEGQCRPGHFRGVLTIVLKLFNMVGADVAFFGQKDFQQAAVLRRMVDDLNVPIRIEVCPTIREPDGLAMSSRNQYLSPEGRKRSLVLWKSLCLADELLQRNERDAAVIVARMRETILEALDAQIDYVALVDPTTLEPVSPIERETLAVLAVRIDGTRLIDNRLLDPPDG